MAALYSTAFIKSHGGASVTYTVPDGFIAVIRTITAVNTNDLIPEGAQLYLGHSSCTVWQATLSNLIPSSPGFSVVIDCRVVVEATDTMHTNNDADVDMTVSGYLLSAP